MSMQVRSSEPGQGGRDCPGDAHNQARSTALHKTTYRGPYHLNHAWEGLRTKEAATSPGKGPGIIADSSPKSSFQRAEWTKRADPMLGTPRVLGANQRGLLCCYRSLWCVHTWRAACSSGLQEDAVELEKSNWKQSKGRSCCLISRDWKSWDASVCRGEGSEEIGQVGLRLEKHEGGEQAA